MPTTTLTPTNRLQHPPVFTIYVMLVMKWLIEQAVLKPHGGETRKSRAAL
jgi:hypothetical protein